MDALQPPPVPTAPVRSEADRRLGELLRRLRELPTLPAVATRLLELSADDHSDSAEVVRVIESDPAFSIAVVRMLAAADRTTQSRPASIQRAVLSLGFHAVRDAALAVGVLAALPAAEDGKGLDFEAFWTHGVATGVAAERLATACPGAGIKPGDAFLPAMLHDVGKLALQVVLPGAYARVVEAARRHGMGMAEAEMRVLGINHQTAGRHLAQHWGLPAAITDCIAMHGRTPPAAAQGPHFRLVQLVTAADALVRARHLGESGSHDVATIHVDTLEALGLTHEAAAAAVEGIEHEVGERIESLGVASGGGGDPMRLYAAAVGRAHAELIGANRRLARAAASAAERQHVLGALEAFLSASMAARRGGLEATAGAVATSALSAIGSRRCLVFVREATFTPDITVGEESHQVDRRWIVADSAQAGATTFNPGDLPWPPAAADLPGLLPDAAGSTLHTLVVSDSGSTSQHPAGGPDEAAVAVVFSDATNAGAPPPTLAAAWRSALAAAAAGDRADGLAERLAAAGRRFDADREAMTNREADARLREVAAGAVDEMHRPLAVITDRAKQLATRLDGESLPLVKATRSSAERLEELVEALGMFARPPVAHRRPTDAARIAADAVESVRASRPLRREQMEPLQITLRPGPDLEAVGVDPDMLRASLDELITNALQAHPASVVTVRVFVTPADPGVPHARAELVAEVNDDGTGMDEEAIREAANPFFSRQPAGRRAGLGLCRVGLWAAAHGGGLRLQNTAGGGVSAQLRFPLG